MASPRKLERLGALATADIEHGLEAIGVTAQLLTDRVLTNDVAERPEPLDPNALDGIETWHVRTVPLPRRSTTDAPPTGIGGVVVSGYVGPR